MKKMTTCFLFLCLAAAAFAQGGAAPFLTELKNFENKDTKKYTDRARQVYKTACNLQSADLPEYTDENGSRPAVLAEAGEDTVAQACAAKENDSRFKPAFAKALNYDNTVYYASAAGFHDLALFLFSRGFGIYASNNGDMMFNALAKMPYKKENAEAFQNVLAAADKMPAKNLREMMLAQNGQTGYSPLHNIAIYTPVNKKFTDVKTAQQNMRPSFQAMLLEQFWGSENMRPHLCAAMALQDKQWKNNALNLAINLSNKEAFYNLAIAFKNAGCSDDMLKKILTDKNAAGQNLRSAVLQNKDEFYFNALMLIPDFKDISNALAKDQLQEASRHIVYTEPADRQPANAPQDGGLLADSSAKGLTAGLTAGVSRDTNGAKNYYAGGIDENSVAGPKPRAFAPSDYGYKYNPKNPVTVNNDNLAAAQRAMYQDDAGLKNKALKQYNRVLADKALNVPDAKDSNAFFGTMLSKDSPFAVFDTADHDNNLKVAGAYRGALDAYKAKKEKNIDRDKGLLKKVRKCNEKADDFKFVMQELRSIKNQVATRGPSMLNDKKGRGELKQMTETYKESDKVGLIWFKELTKQQQEIIDKSGDKFIAERCFDSRRNNAGFELKQLSQDMANAMAAGLAQGAASWTQAGGAPVTAAEPQTFEERKKRLMDELHVLNPKYGQPGEPQFITGAQLRAQQVTAADMRQAYDAQTIQALNRQAQRVQTLHNAAYPDGQPGPADITAAYNRDLGDFNKMIAALPNPAPAKAYYASLLGAQPGRTDNAGGGLKLIGMDNYKTEPMQLKGMDDSKTEEMQFK